MVGVYISGLAFVWGTLFDPELGGFIGTLPDIPQGYTVWSAVESLLPSEKGSAHLSRCNLGWFCHREPLAERVTERKAKKNNSPGSSVVLVEALPLVPRGHRVVRKRKAHVVEPPRYDAAVM
jgi:hypothetical protein